ncbi:hypothetical protein INS49_006498 [Diaporthe citri]|uniref:uncharacterized protein n=1 Tax=Diaporthe citri TaxID=83186 RepID=UPI001C7EFEBD|nr:uncharacterized protein INS49_006498 [Diaporthe citri]KAG6364894.1 hypothetical protein INS49_006498 [Diaporthe citri]
MTVTNPTEADANGGAAHSTSLDEAPTLNTRQHLEYLVGLIINEWKKTMVKWHNASADAVTASAFHELVFYNPDEDSVIKFRVDKVPDAIHHKVDALQHMQRVGLPRLPALIELVREELAKDPFADDPYEDGDSKETSFTGMLIELAKNRIFMEYVKFTENVEKKETTFNLKVVFVDKSGNMRLKQCCLQHDTDFASFLVLMDNYPQEFNLNTVWAASFWVDKLRDLKKKGYDGHPKLVEIEQLIVTQKATNYNDVPKWMFYKTNQRVAYAVPIENEHDFKHVINIVTNPAKDNRLACMIRAVDKDLIYISDELKFFEKNLQESGSPSNQAGSQHTGGDPGNQQPNDERAPGIDSFTIDDCSFDLLARTLGVGFNWAFLSDDDDEEEDRQLPWSLVKNFDKS